MKYSQIANLRLGEKFIKLRQSYREKGIPTALEETMNLLTQQVAIKKPKSILEIGTATGMSGIAMLSVCEGSLTTIEKEESSFLEASKNFEDFGFKNRVTQHVGDAGEIIKTLDKTYDFIFLDGPKARYLDYFPILKKLLNFGGVLFADNVLFRGYIDGTVKHTHKYNTIVRNMREFLDLVLFDEDFISSVLEVGDGVLIAYKL